MGRALLILACAFALAGCTQAERLGPDGPHAGMSCAACHRGAVADFGRATVPDRACTAAGCHADLGPIRAEITNVAFRHRRHGEAGAVTTSCAGCHTHDRGRSSLHGSVDACALCHYEQIAERETRDCGLCHPSPAHIGLTSQGVPVPHSSQAVRQISCTRCHYDVAEPHTGVSFGRCLECHERPRLLPAGPGQDLHPVHEGVTCTACHVSGVHQIQAMSSAASLVCADCHRAVHNLEPASLPAPGICGDCHHDVHGPQQHMVLGLVPGLEMPGTKFLAGVSCRSCHLAGAGEDLDLTQPVRATPAGCAACHGEAYGPIQGWWVNGVRQRHAWVNAFVEGARQQLEAGAPDTVVRLLDASSAMLALVAEGGGYHNLELSDRVFRESLRRTQEAYVLAARSPPAPPALGGPPRMGFCTFCHYTIDESWSLQRMPAGVHEDMVRRQEEAAAREQRRISGVR